jgi:quercetin dioxygenase-like cupin family protein
MEVVTMSIAARIFAISGLPAHLMASLFDRWCLKLKSPQSLFGMFVQGEIAAHVHPHGQDTWTVLSGSAGYYQGSGVVTKLQAGEIAVAKPGQVHGAMNTDSKESFIFVSVVAPGNAGFALAEK